MYHFDEVYVFEYINLSFKFGIILRLIKIQYGHSVTDRCKPWFMLYRIHLVLWMLNQKVVVSDRMSLIFLKTVPIWIKCKVNIYSSFSLFNVNGTDRKYESTLKIFWKSSERSKILAIFCSSIFEIFRKNHLFHYSCFWIQITRGCVWKLSKTVKLLVKNFAHQPIFSSVIFQTIFNSERNKNSKPQYLTICSEHHFFVVSRRE